MCGPRSGPNQASKRVTWCVPVGVRCGTTGPQEGCGPGLKLTLLLPEEEAACSLNPGEGGVRSPKAGAGAPDPPLVQVSASLQWKEQRGHLPCARPWARCSGSVLSLAPVERDPQAREEWRTGVMLPVWVPQHTPAKHSESDHFPAFLLLLCGYLPPAPGQPPQRFPAALATPPPHSHTVCSPSSPHAPVKTLHHNPPVVPIWRQPATPASRDLCPQLPSSHLTGPPATRPSAVPPASGHCPALCLPASPDVSMAGCFPVFFYSGSFPRTRL